METESLDLSVSTDFFKERIDLVDSDSVSTVNKRRKRRGILGASVSNSPMLFNFTSKELWPDEKSDEAEDTDEDYLPNGGQQKQSQQSKTKQRANGKQKKRSKQKQPLSTVQKMIKTENNDKHNITSPVTIADNADNIELLKNGFTNNGSHKSAAFSTSLSTSLSLEKSKQFQSGTTSRINQVKANRTNNKKIKSKKSPKKVSLNLCTAI